MTSNNIQKNNIIKHAEKNCQKCPENISNCKLYEAIKNYKEVSKIKKEADNIKDYAAGLKARSILGSYFKEYARATQILKYEIGIFKELREEKDKNGEIKLIGVCNSQYNARKALRENESDPVKLAIIKEDIADNEAIEEGLEADESYWQARNNF